MSEIDIRRRVAAAPDRVWESFTDPEILASWFWPPSWRTEVAIDLRVGGAYRIRSESGGLGVSGEYVSLDPPNRMVFTWRWDDDPEETLVTIDVAADGAGTLLRIRHERFSDDQTRAANAVGWESCLDRLPGA